MALFLFGVVTLVAGLLRERLGTDTVADGDGKQKKKLGWFGVRRVSEKMGWVGARRVWGDEKRRTYFSW